MNILILTKARTIYYGEFVRNVSDRHRKRFIELKNIYWKRNSKNGKELDLVFISRQWINAKNIKEKKTIDISDIKTKTYKELLELLEC